MATKKPPRPPIGLRAPLTPDAVRRAAAAPTKPLARAPVVRAEALVREVRRLRATIDQSFYELGQTLRELKQPERYRELGYDTFEALLDGRELGSRVTAHKLVAIVETFDAPTAKRLGIEKAYEVSSYVKLAHPDESAKAVLTLDPVVRNDPSRSRLSAISGRALALAVRALRAAARGVPAISPARLAKASRGLAQLLRHAGIDAERVQTKPRRGKPPVIRIELTVEEAEDLIALMRERKKEKP